MAPFYCRARAHVPSTRWRPRTFPWKAMRRTAPDGTRTEAGPDLVHRPLQCRGTVVVAGRFVGFRGGLGGGFLAEERPLLAGVGGAAHELLARDPEQPDAG